jgi:simple sugar transport system permease protein
VIEDIALFLEISLSAGSVLLLATLGEIIAERSGILNLGVEGMMSVGALSAFYTSLITQNPYLGIVVGGLMGLALSVVHAFTSVTLKANQVLSGLGLAILGLGISGFFGKPVVGKIAPSLDIIPIPILGDIPFLGIILFRQDVLTYLSLLSTVVMAYIMYRTKIGLMLRTVGENPEAADYLGVNVDMIRYLATMIGGLYAGLAGAQLSLVHLPSWIENMTAGRGWIALALVILSLWNPILAPLASTFFGALSILPYYLQIFGFKVGTGLLAITPYLGTVLIMTLISMSRFRRLVGAPAALARPYIRGEKEIYR